MLFIMVILSAGTTERTFMANYFRPLEQQLSILEQLITKASASFKTKPPGNLIIQKCKQSPQYLYRPAKGNPSRHYIRKDNLAFARLLAQKEYEEDFLKAAFRQKENLQKLLSKGSICSASVLYHSLALPYEKLSKERQQLVTPYVLPDDLYIQSFLQTTYEPLGFEPFDSVILTNKGERVRSKSEKILADILTSMDIPYLYEKPLYLTNLGWIRPDLTLLDIRERETIIHEHFGRMDMPSYVSKNLIKIEAYIHEGYLLGDRLLFTFEGGNHILDLKAFEKIIRQRFFE